MIISHNNTIVSFNNFIIDVESVVSPDPTPTPPTPTGNTINLLIIGDADVNNVINFISSGFTGQNFTNYTISGVTAGLTFSGSSNLINNYNVILYYTNSGQYGSTALSNNLRSFVNAGGGLVTATFVWNLRPSNFDLSLTTYSGASSQTAKIIVMNNIISHPITSGLTTTITNSNWFCNLPTTLTSGATTITTIAADGTPFIGVNTIGSARFVSINTHPANGGLSGYPNMRPLFARAIMWAAKIIN
jgi:hypothetical protein